MRKLFSVFCFSLILLLIGRNLTFLPRFELFTNKKNQTEKLKQDIQTLTKSKTGSYSVYYSSFNSDMSFGINEKQIFTAASVNKVPIVTALYYLASTGKINLDEQVTLQENDIQDYGTGSLRYQKPGGLYSLKTLAKLALQQSDNTAAYILANKIGEKEIERIMQGFGLSQTSITNNKSSLSDMQILFRRLYNNQVTNKALTKELMGFLKDTDFEDRLPSKLQNTTVYHKTGDEAGIIHDVGIVEKDDTVFFVGVFTSEIGNTEKETKETIGEIAKRIVDFEKSFK